MRATKESVRNKVEPATRQALPIVSTDAIWASYLAESAFQFRVWSTMQVCAVAVYNAYDGFLFRCTEGEEGRIGDRVKRRFRSELYQELFQLRDIQIARVLRHAVSHNRGRMTEELENLKPGLVTVHGSGSGPFFG